MLAKRKHTGESGDFPRGGGLSVTPLEYKQIVAEAQAEAAADGPTAQGTEDLFGAGGRGAPNKAKTAASKRSASRTAKTAKGQPAAKKSKQKHDENYIRIDSVTLKNISKDTALLACVVQVRDDEMVVAIADFLQAYLPITKISRSVSSRLEELATADADDDGDDNEGSDVDEIPSLTRMYKIGDWLRVVVTETEKNQKKHIIVSAEPSLTNRALERDNFRKGMLVMGTVKELVPERGGAIVDIGLDDISGFVKRMDKLDRPVTEGTTLLFSCESTEVNGRTIALRPFTGRDSMTKVGDVKTVLPGVKVPVLVTEIRENGIVGKAFGMVDCFADAYHCNVASGKKLSESFKPGQTLEARVISSRLAREPPVLQVSFSPNLVALDDTTSSEAGANAFPIGFTCDTAKVVTVQPSMGVFFELASNAPFAFAHVSRLDAEKTDLTTEKAARKFKHGSVHQCRILSYSPFENLYQVSLEPDVLNKQYIRVEDVPIGEIMTGTVKKLIPAGCEMEVEGNLRGFVPSLHLADVQLVHPEKKFREGMKFKCRVLNRNIQRHSLTLTMKKTIVNSDAEILTSYEQARHAGSTKFLGVITRFMDSGALVECFDGVKGFLPVGQMSEAYIKRAADHFQLGQTISFRVLSADPDAKRIVLSCRDDKLLTETDDTLNEVKIPSIVSAQVTDIGANNCSVLLGESNSGIRASLSLYHMSDQDTSRCQQLFSRLHVGKYLKKALVIGKNPRSNTLIISLKKSLISAAEEGSFPSNVEMTSVGAILHGFVRNVTDFGVFVEFGNGLVGLALKKDLSSTYVAMPSSMFSPYQSVKCKVLSIDAEQGQFLLSLNPDTLDSDVKVGEASQIKAEDLRNDLSLGSICKAKIIGVTPNQINVDLSAEAQGRVDSSLAFGSIADIKNTDAPLKQFKKGQLIEAKIVGYHDARTHRFLPITNRKGKRIVYELSMVPEHIKADKPEIMTIDNVSVGMKCMCFINNIADDFVWVNVSPSLRGRINMLELSEDIDVLRNFRANFHVGSCLQATIISKDLENQNVSLSLRQGANGPGYKDISDLEQNAIMTGRVTKVLPTGVLVQLSSDLSGRISLTDISDDYQSEPTKSFEPGSFIRVMVVKVDMQNKHVYLSCRPSLLKRDSEAVAKDPVVETAEALKIGQHYRGYIKNITDHGLYVALGRDVTARVKISQLFDGYVKDWKPNFVVGQLVNGRVISTKDGRVEMSFLMNARVDSNESFQKGMADMAEGDVVSGKVRKMEDYGLIIRIEGTQVDALCHTSEISSQPIDVAKFYKVGDVVKAKILKIDRERRRVGLGLKPSYFEGDSDEALEDEDMADERSDEESTAESGEELGDSDESDETGESDSESSNEDVHIAEEHMADSSGALHAGAFQWDGVAESESDESESEGSEEAGAEEQGAAARQVAGSNKADVTAKMQEREAESEADFERLVLAYPNSSAIWIKFASFQLDHADAQAARRVFERALGAISYREEREKLNVWLAMINLEHAFGTDESLHGVVQRAAQYNDDYTIYRHVAGVYANAGHMERAQDVYQGVLKRHSQNIAIWAACAQFFMEHGLHDEARALLPRALQSLARAAEQLQITQKFAQLEFKVGDAERGRTIFEGLLANYPRRLDVWSVYIDMESKAGEPDRVRSLFDRALAMKQSSKKAKFLFKKLLAFEKEEGDADSVAAVVQRARDYVDAN